MAYIERHTVSVTTDASGDATAYTEQPVNGYIHSIAYTKHATTPFDAGVDFDVTLEDSGVVVWNEDDVDASAHPYPRAATHDTVGVASLYAAAGEPVEDRIVVANERIKIVVAAGGNAKVGTFDIWIA